MHVFQRDPSRDRQIPPGDRALFVGDKNAINYRGRGVLRLRRSLTDADCRPFGDRPACTSFANLEMEKVAAASRPYSGTKIGGEKK